MTVTAHQITNDWELTKSSAIPATWNNVGYDSSVLDYVRYETAAEHPFTLAFDITKLAKGWYDGTAGRYGIALSSDANDLMSVSSAYAIYAETRPVFTIVYKNFTGTEPGLTYHTHPVGTNGEGSVSDYLGSLSYKQKIYESTGSRMPVTITATYNSILKDRVFGNNSASGYGWQFSFNQYIDETSSSLQSAGYPYVYTDEDGTQHYFKQKEDSATEWEDEDDLGLTLTKDSNYVYITNQDEVIQKYALPANGGNLLTETDQYKNVRTYTYDADKNLTKITDGAGREYTLTYTVNSDTSKKRITKITVPDGKAITFDYNYMAGDKDRLLYVRYPGSRSYTFTYASDGSGYLAKITAPDTTYIKYTYTDGKVTQVAEYGKQNTAGNYLNITYNSNNTTTYTDRQGRSETYTFDNGGTTVTTLNANGYITNTGESSNTSADMKFSSGSESHTKNYIKNSSAESTNGYTKKAWNDANTGSFTLDKSTDLVEGEKVQYLGKASFKVEQTSASDTTTFYQTVPASGLTGKKVTFSTYFKAKWTDGAKKDKGVLLRARYLNAQGQEISTEDGNVYVQETGWKRLSGTFTVPGNAANIEIHCGIKENKGKVWFDCMQLEEGECMNDYNALENSDFSRSDSWQGGRTIAGNPTGKRALPQQINVNKAGVAFNIYGSAKGNSVPLKDDRKFGIKLSIYYADTTIPVEEHYQAFNEYTTAQQSNALLVEPEKPNEVINYVKFSFVYDYNLGIMYAYNAMVGVGAIDPNASDDTEEPTEPGEDATVSTEPYQGEVETHDSYGNITQTIKGTVLTDADEKESIDTSKPYISNGKTYDSTGNYVKTETDAAGNTVTYHVNTANGLTNSVTDGEDNTTSYTYDENTDNLTGISGDSAEGTITNGYAYSKGNQPTSITHNGFSYTFGYDLFGNQKSASVAGQSLITNSYAANNGNLLKTTYGNGDEISYTYDAYDRLISASNGDGVLATYIYNKKGMPAKAVDASSGLTTFYEYDIYGNLVNESSFGQNSIFYYDSYTDSEGHKVQRTNINGTVKTVTKSEDSEGNSVLNNDGWIVSKVIDGLDRTQTIKTAPSGDTNAFTTDYTYIPGQETNAATELVASITQKYGNTNLAQYSYTYDGNGNITTVKENGTKVAQYVYDEANQLISAADGKEKTFTFYTYDTAGNITNVTAKNLSTSGWYPTTEISSTDYTYGDTSWKDKLTSYDGQSITYDEIGNSLTYRDGMTMTWLNGRQLASLSKGNTQVTYRYDANGMRTAKTVNNTAIDQTRETKYYYDSNQKLIAIYGLFGNIMHFYYDGDGKINSMSYAGEMYYYVTNLMGDVTKLLKSDGTVAANYEYDAWGKLLSVTDANGKTIGSSMHIGLMNPFRYRGYVYDDETGLYYLQSRYYDPTTGRFLNADHSTILKVAGSKANGCNLFLYCFNNPVNYSDPSGYVAANIIGAIIGGIIGAVGGYYLANFLADKLNLRGWKRNVFVWGLTALIGASAAAIGWFLGPYVARAWAWITARLAGLLKGTFRDISIGVEPLNMT